MNLDPDANCRRVALRDDVLDDGYAELAQLYGRVEERAERRAARDRYAARTEAAVCT